MGGDSPRWDKNPYPPLVKNGGGGRKKSRKVKEVQIQKASKHLKGQTYRHHLAGHLFHPGARINEKIIVSRAKKERK